MGKRGVGSTFCFIASVLFSARYISAAIFMSGLSSTWDSELFASGLEYAGTPLRTLSIVSFIIGVGYLVWAEVSEKKK
ncbi:hypothetical protein [Lacrimispora brassicae]